MDPAFEAFWKQVLDHWGEDSAHGVFLEYCQRTDQLVDAAVRYRGMAGDRLRADVARRRLSAISVLAIAQLESTRTTPSVAERRSRLLVFAMLVLSILAALVVHLGSNLE